MSPALTAAAWLKTFDRYRRISTSTTVTTMAHMLYEIVNTSEDPKVAEVLDAFGSNILEKP